MSSMEWPRIEALAIADVTNRPAWAGLTVGMLAAFAAKGVVEMTVSVRTAAPELKVSELNPVVTSDNLILEFTADLDEGPAIHAGAFTVRVNGSPSSHSVYVLRVASRFIVLMLTSPVHFEDTVTLTYQGVAGSRLRAADGVTEIAPFTTSVYNQAPDFMAGMQPSSPRDPTARPG